MSNLLIQTAAVALLSAAAAWAHCDGLDGPVVSAAREALAKSNPDLVLMWVPARDEAAIRDAFARTLRARKLGGEAQKLADTWFFETVVRLHRAGEGAPYQGLQPAGRDVGAAIPAADRAVATRDAAALEAMLTRAVQNGLRRRFAKVVERGTYDSSNTAAAREYVAAYVDLLHYAERLEQISGATPDHAHEH